MKPERILVTGGREYNDAISVNKVLDEARPYFAESFCIIQGTAKGADSLAAAWAKARGIPLMSFPANWDFYQLSAGQLRNHWMLQFGRPELVIAFPGGSGTAGMVKIAKAAGIAVYEIR